MNAGRTLALCAALLLSACHGDSSQAPAAGPMHVSSKRTVKRGPTPEELTAGMVEAVSIGKSTAPVGMKFELGSRPIVGQPFDVVVALMPQIPADPAVLQVSGSDGLELPAGGPIEIPAVEPTQVYRHTITLMPTAAGVQLLNLHVSLQHDDITESRAFALPVIVAAAGDPAPGAAH